MGLLTEMVSIDEIENKERTTVASWLPFIDELMPWFYLLGASRHYTQIALVLQAEDNGREEIFYYIELARVLVALYHDRTNKKLMKLKGRREAEGWFFDIDEEGMWVATREFETYTTASLAELLGVIEKNDSVFHGYFLNIEPPPGFNHCNSFVFVD